ncbi:hypothetical protein NPIL_167751 [Nephila pilipes]|uniref:Uncharacterized protein n=1 Tax=Nephila pilipes TaxID=299642 RepID=A0A8X6QTD0_NEPPI|nr:hypothetical protein NPIL_167751 [Nephila pilipes]
MKLLAWLRSKLCNSCGEKETENETAFEISEEFEIIPSVSGFPFIQYPHFPEDDIEEPKTNGKRKYKCKLCGFKPKTKKGKRHHNITKHKIGVLLQQLPTLDSNGRPLNFFTISDTIIESKCESKEIIDTNASYERQMSWALRESAEMAASHLLNESENDASNLIQLKKCSVYRGHFQKNRGIVILN